MKLTLITVSYNSESTIRDTLESVRSQIYKPDEYIIIDGNSQDTTLEICDEYRDIITHVVSENDNGIYDAMNKGIKLSSGDIIGLLNSDDTYLDEYVLHRVVTSFERGNNIFCGGVNYVRHDYSIVRSWFLKDKVKEIAKGWHPPHPGFFVSKTLYQNCGLFRLEYPIAADFDLMVRMLRSPNADIEVYRYPIVNMKLGGESNSSLKNILQGNREIRNSLKSQGLKVTYWYTIKRLLSKILQYV